MSATIHLGVAGWDYPDWTGIVYPARTGREFDRLAWVARFVDVVEINSTFYRPARPAVAESWLRRIEPFERFVFTAKSHRSWSHLPDLPPRAEVARTLDGLAPLREAGRLGALLLQFPQSFHDEPASRDRIERLLPLVEDWPLVVEVRHVSWEAAEAAEWFRALGVGWCAVDQPRVDRSTAGTLPRVTGPVGYIRLHGRNAADWFRAGAGRDARYDYLYPEHQLRELTLPIREMAEQAAHLFVVQNNHFRGQALANTLQLAHLLRGVAPLAPEELVDAYPQLAPQVDVVRRRLF